MLPGVFPTMPAQSIVIDQDVVDTFNPFPLLNNPPGPVLVPTLIVAPNVSVGSAAPGDYAMDLTEFHEDSVGVLINLGYISPKGGNGASHGQGQRVPSDKSSCQHCSGGGGGAGFPVGTGGLGTPGNGVFSNNDPPGVDADDGTDEAGGSATANPIDQVSTLNAIFWDVNDANSPDIDAEAGSSAIGLSFELFVANGTGRIYASGGGGAAGITLQPPTLPEPAPFQLADPGDGGGPAEAGAPRTDPSPGFPTEPLQELGIESLPGDAGTHAIKYTTSAAEALFVTGGVEGVDIKGDVGT